MDEESSENESVSTSVSIIGKLKRALKRKKVSTRERSSDGAANNNKRRKNVVHLKLFLNQ